MRKLTLFFFLAGALTSYSQEKGKKITVLGQASLIANYTLTFKEDSLNFEDVSKEDFLLFIGNDMSRFVGKTYYKILLELKSIKTKTEHKEWFNNFSSREIYFRYLNEFYKDFAKNKITSKEHCTAGTFIYEEELDLFDWKLTNINDTIAGYFAQQATADFGGRNWIAWFSPEIPINDGPYKFNGLPGLIVRIHDTRMHYHFELSTIEKPNEPVDIELSEHVNSFRTTKMMYFRAEDYARQNIVSTVKAAGNGIEAQQHVAKKMAARNNPIELKRK